MLELVVRKLWAAVFTFIQFGVLQVSLAGEPKGLTCADFVAGVAAHLSLHVSPPSEPTARLKEKFNDINPFTWGFRWTFEIPEVKRAYENPPDEVLLALIQGDLNPTVFAYFQRLSAVLRTAIDRARVEFPETKESEFRQLINASDPESLIRAAMVNYANFSFDPYTEIQGKIIEGFILGLPNGTYRVEDYKAPSPKNPVPASPKETIVKFPIALDSANQDERSVTIDLQVNDRGHRIAIATFPGDHAKGFVDGTAAVFLRKMKVLMEQGRIDGVILDLLWNPGGLAYEAANVVSSFLSKGAVILYEFSPKQKEVEKWVTSSKGIFFGMPLMVLVNGRTASASEAIANAVRGNGAGLILGLPTAGKGTSQNVFKLGDSYSLKVTTHFFYGPNGQIVQKSGVIPDVAYNKPPPPPGGGIRFGSGVDRLPPQEFPEFIIPPLRQPLGPRLSRVLEPASKAAATLVLPNRDFDFLPEGMRVLEDIIGGQ